MRTLHEKVDLGQVEGGLAQGIGWMTVEDLRFDDSGRIQSHALATYKVPDVDCMPDDLEAVKMRLGNERSRLDQVQFEALFVGIALGILNALFCA